MITKPLRLSIVTICLAPVLLAAAGGGCQTKQVATQPERVMTKSVMPCLMFQDGRAEEAINRYVEVFSDARVIFIKKYGSDNIVGAKENSIEQAEIEIHGRRIMVTESPIKHPFDFTPSVSLFVDFDSEREIDRVFAELSEGGAVMMPLDDYFFSHRFAWIQDRYGVSWQLNLPSASAAQ